MLKRNKSFYIPEQSAGSSNWTKTLVAYKITKHSKLFWDSEFVKHCIVHVTEAVCLENKTTFENTSLSRTTVRHMEKWMVI